MTDSPTAKHRRARLGRRRFAPMALVAGVVASAAIATSMTGTLGAFTASITNNQNNTASGYLTMQENGSASTGSASAVCNSTDSTTLSNNAYATCSLINKYGGSSTLVPGNTVNTSITIKNTGSVPANTFTLSPGVCTQNASPNAPTVGGTTVTGSATDLCSKLSLTVTEAIGAGTASTVINNQTLASLSTITSPATAPASITLNGPIPSGTTATFTFALTFSSTADNTYQALQAKQALTWTFTS